MITVGLPSGIGDCSWAYSKLVNAGARPYEIADGWPYRTVAFFELLPGCSRVKFGSDFNYETIVMNEKAMGLDRQGITWEEIEAMGMERVLLQPNHHLERGLPLAEWLPDLPTTYHYPIETSASMVAQAEKYLANLPRPILAYSCASYRGAQAWKTWESEEWMALLDWWQAEVGGSLIALGGSWDDLTASVATQTNSLDLVGKTHIGVVIEILRRIEYYVGFSSGLGILRTVLKKPVFMLWPDHQVALSTSWAPPEMLDLGTYATSLYRAPSMVTPLVKRWLGASQPWGD